MVKLHNMWLRFRCRRASQLLSKANVKRDELPLVAAHPLGEKEIETYIANGLDSMPGVWFCFSYPCAGYSSR